MALLARTTAERLRPQYDDQMVTLVVGPSTSADAYCDPDRITQVLVNLLGNALAACDPHGHVTLSVHTGPAPVRHLIVRVTDDGIGIAAPDLERIFHRFERLEHPGRPAANGSGLTIARASPEPTAETSPQHPGLGNGATFTLHLPREPTPDHSNVRNLKLQLNPWQPGGVLRYGHELRIAESGIPILAAVTSWRSGTLTSSERRSVPG